MFMRVNVEVRPVTAKGGSRYQATDPTSRAVLESMP
jgi:hypothetical protein